LKRSGSQTHITIASSSPDWFWNETPVDAVIPGSLSPTAVEKNGIPDRELTAARLRKFLGMEKELLAEETRLQREIAADLVVTDIDPLPVKAALMNRIPAVGIGNFTWDWILGEMCPDMKEQTGRIANMYSSGTYLRLPLGPDHSPFNTTLDMPLLRGGSPGNTERVKKLLPEDGLKYLVAFRHLPKGFPEKAPEGVTVFTALPEPQSPGWLNISHRELVKNNASFADLVASADVVITKPGYGIVSQILAMGKRAVLVPFLSFPEEKYLLNGLVGRNATAVVHAESVRQVFSKAAETAGKPVPEPVYSNGCLLIAAFIRKKLL
jgi:L-arabinokinase